MTTKLEVHEHSYVAGGGNFSHSHEGGNAPHQHPGTGPACFTIDKDRWQQLTGYNGGGRKKFTAKPTGMQMPIVELEDWQRTFDVIVDESSCRRFVAEAKGRGHEVTGPGGTTVHRMALGFGMTPVLRVVK